MEDLDQEVGTVATLFSIGNGSATLRVFTLEDAAEFIAANVSSGDRRHPVGRAMADAWGIPANPCHRAVKAVARDPKYDWVRMRAKRLWIGGEA